MGEPRGASLDPDQNPAKGTEPGHVAPLHITRRTLFRRSSAVVATAGVGALAGCSLTDDDEAPGSTTQLDGRRIPTAEQYSGVAGTPHADALPSGFRTFSEHEAVTVEALTARILPGDESDPGAREAGVVNYIDGLLSSNDGFVEVAYLQGPYAHVASSEETAQATPGATPEASPISVADGALVAADQILRYGYQSMLSPRDVYRLGLQSVDSYANELFGMNFVELGEDQQDTIVGDMLTGQATGFGPELSGPSFFHNLRRHTSEGMFSDPIYGGNRNLAGWRLVGYPGAQRAYEPAEFQREGTDRQPQSIADMPHFHAGRPADEPNVLLPVSGSDPDREGEGNGDHDH